jgi:type II secretory pathway predicted ATPase ExeA
MTKKEKWKIAHFSFIVGFKYTIITPTLPPWHFAMYTEYFGLKEKPFTISPDPRYLYMSEHHREALAHLLYGISSDGCIVLLTGGVGTGKTTVCRSLLEQLPDKTEAAFIVNPKLSVDELLETICEELSIAFERRENSVKSYIDGINRHLLRSHAEGKTTVLIIDEAQNLEMEVLEQLRLLTNLETNTAKLLKIILIGQPELLDKLKNPKALQINQRITSKYHLEPLSESDAYGFIQHRLIVAGGGRMRFFSDNALKCVYQMSKGIPRMINVLCDRALLGAYVEEKGVYVSEKIMLQAGREVLGDDVSHTLGSNSKSFYMKAIYVVVAIFLGAAAILFISGKPTAFSDLWGNSSKLPVFVPKQNITIHTLSNEQAEPSANETIIEEPAPLTEKSSDN